MGYFQSDPWYDVVEAAERSERRVPVFRDVPGSGRYNTLDTRAPAVILEFEELCFHHNSVVTLPCLPSAMAGEQDHYKYEDEELMADFRRSHPNAYQTYVDSRPGYFNEDAHDRRAMILLAVTYRFLRNNHSYRLVIAGHTDSTGSDKINFSLSDKRAENVLALLTGDRDGWADSSASWSTTRDIQRILRHFAHTNPWNCDPGSVDDIPTYATSDAIRNFQSHYNDSYHSDITVDGVVGTQTWGAIFDVYIDELTRLMKIEKLDLPAERSHLRYADSAKKTIGCGERIPIDGVYRDNYKSQEDRRVELLFFHEKGLPDLSVHASGGAMRAGSATREQSTIYAPGLHVFAFLDPIWWESDPPVNSYDPEFEIRDVMHDLPSHHIDPDSEDYHTSHPVTPHEEDPWDFIVHFDEHHPGHGCASDHDHGDA